MAPFLYFSFLLRFLAGISSLVSYSPHLNTKRQKPHTMARFLVQTIPNKLPELLINRSCQGPHLMGATLPTLLRAVHPGTIEMTDFRQRLRPKVLTRHLGDL